MMILKRLKLKKDNPEKDDSERTNRQMEHLINGSSDKETFEQMTTLKRTILKKGQM